MAEQVPENGRLRAAAVLLEHASKEVAEEAHLAQDKVPCLLCLRSQATEIFLQGYACCPVVVVQSDTSLTKQTLVDAGRRN